MYDIELKYKEIDYQLCPTCGGTKLYMISDCYGIPCPKCQTKDEDKEEKDVESDCESD